MSLIPKVTSVSGVKEVHGSPTLRTILNRVDGLDDSTPSQFAVSKVADTPMSIFQVRFAELASMLRSAYADVARDNGRLAMAFCGGFGLPLLVGSFLVWPMTAAPHDSARPASLVQERYEAASVTPPDRMVGAFAAPFLTTPPTLRSSPNEAPLALIVPRQFEAEVGRSTPFGINFTAGGQVPAGSFVRIASLPPYVGLSAGKPGVFGTWLVDPQAVSDLRLTVYTINAAPQIVDIDLVDTDGGLLARAQTQLAVKVASLEHSTANLAAVDAGRPVVAINHTISPPLKDLVLKSSTPKPAPAPQSLNIKAPKLNQAPVASPKRTSITNTARATKDSPRSVRPMPKVTTKPLPPRVTASNAQVPPLEGTLTGIGRSARLPTERAPAAWSAAWQRSTLGYSLDRP